jgi:hypothetical protein
MPFGAEHLQHDRYTVSVRVSYSFPPFFLWFMLPGLIDIGFGFGVLNSFPNIGGFQSVAFNKTSQGLQSDSLVSVITTMGMPATWLAYVTPFHSVLNTRFIILFYRYYSVQSSFQFSLNWSNLFNTNNPDTSASFSASTYATGMAFPRLIEFDDVNGNRVYDIDVDTVVSTYVTRFM